MIFKIMSYHINGGKDVAGNCSPELVAQIIRSLRADVVLLQKLGPSPGPASLESLATLTGLSAYGPDRVNGCAFLSRFPLTNTFDFPLGSGCRCVRADLELDHEQVHLFNLVLTPDLRQRQKQIGVLMSDQVLGNPSLPSALIIGGDFGFLPFLGITEEGISRSRFPLWRATFPAQLPLLGRDRIYFRGSAHALSGRVETSSEARRASTHLPLIVTVETRETRRTLKIKKGAAIGSKQPDPVCG